MCGRVHCDKVTSFTLDTRKKAKPLAVLTALSVLVLLGSTLALQKRWGTLQTARMVQGMSATVVAVELAFIILGIKNAYCSKKPAKPLADPEKNAQVAEDALKPISLKRLEEMHTAELGADKTVKIVLTADDKVGEQGTVVEAIVTWFSKADQDLPATVHLIYDNKGLERNVGEVYYADQEEAGTNDELP